MGNDLKLIALKGSPLHPAIHKALARANKKADGIESEQSIPKPKAKKKLTPGQGDGITQLAAWLFARLSSGYLCSFLCWHLYMH